MDVLELKGVNSNMLESSNSVQYIHPTSNEQKRRQPKESFCEFDIIETYKRTHRNFNKTTDLVKKIEDLTTRNIQIGLMYGDLENKISKNSAMEKGVGNSNNHKSKVGIIKHVTHDTSERKKKEHKSRSVLRRQIMELTQEKERMQAKLKVSESTDTEEKKMKRRKSRATTPGSGKTNLKFRENPDEIKFKRDKSEIKKKTHFVDDSTIHNSTSSHAPSSTVKNSTDRSKKLQTDINLSNEQENVDRSKHHKGRTKKCSGSNKETNSNNSDSKPTNFETPAIQESNNAKNLITVYENLKPIGSDFDDSKDTVSKCVRIKEPKHKSKKPRDKSKISRKVADTLKSTTENTPDIVATENCVEIDRNEFHQDKTRTSIIETKLIDAKAVEPTLEYQTNNCVIEIQNVHNCNDRLDVLNNRDEITKIKIKLSEEDTTKSPAVDSSKIDRRELSFSKLNLTPVRGLYFDSGVQSATTQTSLDKLNEKIKTRSRSASPINFSLKEKIISNKLCDLNDRKRNVVNDMSKTALAMRDLQEVAEFEKSNLFSLNTEKFKQKGSSISSTVNSSSLLSELLIKQEMTDVKDKKPIHISMNNKFHRSKTPNPTERIVEISSKILGSEKISFTVEGVEPPKRLELELNSNKVSKTRTNLERQVFQGVEICHSDVKLMCHAPKKNECLIKSAEHVMSKDSLEARNSINIVAHNDEIINFVSTSSSRQSPRSITKYKTCNNRKDFSKKKRSRPKKEDCGNNWCYYSDVTDSSTQTTQAVYNNNHFGQHVSPMGLSFKSSINSNRYGLGEFDYLPFNYKSDEHYEIFKPDKRDIGVGVNMMDSAICSRCKEGTGLNLSPPFATQCSYKGSKNVSTSVSNVTLQYINNDNKLKCNIKDEERKRINAEKSIRLHPNTEVNEVQQSLSFSSNSSNPKLKRSKSLCTIKAPPPATKALTTSSDVCISMCSENSNTENKKLHTNKKLKDNLSRIPRPQRYSASLVKESPSSNPRPDKCIFDENPHSRSIMLEDISCNSILVSKESSGNTSKYNQNEIQALEKCLNEILGKLSSVSNDVAPKSVSKPSPPKLEVDTRINVCIKNSKQKLDGTKSYEDVKKIGSNMKLKQLGVRPKKFIKEATHEVIVNKPQQDDFSTNYTSSDTSSIFKGPFTDLPLRNVYANSTGFRSSGTSVCSSETLYSSRKLRTANEYASTGSTNSLPSRMQRKAKKKIKIKYNKIRKPKNKDSYDLKKILEKSSSEIVKSKVVILSVSSTCTIYTTPSNYLNKIQKQLIEQNAVIDSSIIPRNTVFKQDKYLTSKEPFFIAKFEDPNNSYIDSLENVDYNQTINLRPLTGLFNFSPPTCSYVVYNTEVQPFKRDKKSASTDGNPQTRENSENSYQNESKLLRNEDQLSPKFRSRNLESPPHVIKTPQHFTPELNLNAWDNRIREARNLQNNIGIGEREITPLKYTAQNAKVDFDNSKCGSSTFNKNFRDHDNEIFDVQRTECPSAYVNNTNITKSAIYHALRVDALNKPRRRIENTTDDFEYRNAKDLKCSPRLKHSPPEKGRFKAHELEDLESYFAARNLQKCKCTPGTGLDSTGVCRQQNVEKCENISEKQIDVINNPNNFDTDVDDDSASKSFGPILLEAFIDKQANKARNTVKTVPPRIRDKSLERRIYKIQNPVDVQTSANISSFSDFNQSCKNFVINYKPKCDAQIHDNLQKTDKKKLTVSNFDESDCCSTVKNNTLISNESGYESCKTSKSKSIKNFFKKSGNLLDLFKSSVRGKSASRKDSDVSSKITQEKSTTYQSSTDSFNLLGSNTVLWLKTDNKKTNDPEFDLKCESSCKNKNEVCEQTCRFRTAGTNTNIKKPICNCESTYEEQMNECQKYAEKVILESTLRKEGYLKQYNDFKEIPLDILMGKRMCTKCIQRMPFPKPSLLKSNKSKASIVPLVPSSNIVETTIDDSDITPQEKFVSKLDLSKIDIDSAESPISSIGLGHVDNDSAKLSDKEVFDKLLNSYDKEDTIAKRLSKDDSFFEEQLAMAKGTPSANGLRLQEDEEEEEIRPNDKMRAPRFSEKPRPQITNSDCVVQADDIGTCFARGFRPDNLMLSGEACFNMNKQDKIKMTPHMLKNTESTIDFSERETPLDFLLALGFMVDEASNALKDDDIRSRLLAAITEARVWINKITTTQGTLLYLVAYKARPDTMRYFLQLVEAIINKRITNAIKLDGFLRVLQQVEDGRLQMINILGDDKFEEEENEEKVVKKQLKNLFLNVYTIAEKEVQDKNKELSDNQISLLRILVAKYRAGLHPHLELIARYIGQGLLVTEIQLEAAMIFLSRLDTAEVKLKEFENYCGIMCEEAKQKAALP